jgi:diguanylate cyclase (GGDEF)-like protein
LQQQLTITNQQLETVNKTLKHLAMVDGLTQLANRRRFDEYLDLEWKRMARAKLPLSLILCDIDCFKLYNDTYGHPSGDDCLKQVAQVITRVICRPADLAARYGGEEFAVILPDTKLDGAIHLAELIRATVKRLTISHADSLVISQVTLSLGVASLIPCHEMVPATLVATADKLLYEAKQSGRDRVCFQKFTM